MGGGVVRGGGVSWWDLGVSVGGYGADFDENADLKKVYAGPIVAGVWSGTAASEALR